MKSIAAVLAIGVAALAIGQKAKTPAQQLLGSWKYDVGTMKLVLNAKGRAAMNDPEHGAEARAFVTNYQTRLGAFLKGTTLTFRSDKTVIIRSTAPAGQQSGVWSVEGRSVRVVMTNVKQITPKMDLDKSGKRIHTSYSDPNFGTGLVDLVRAKQKGK